ncbi:hypothetical protein [Paenibacillus macquariensis]|uniref:DUF4468 domain-containing protein n=1 Tax=Paenibacillus macquariensis TaxID=948756 RepID=A0ABY1K066_9BACL|nr:hypothetical protein [Paenibacillus macquariensis]MEC0091457.1 hypothetical protein [Paenibacillus macquariensis]OAB38137.1 hypothetical protein PMSM_03080 [Paenibacillus macquariensis subsp. macquariensis]SIR07148.1 hypothetical protein SAMN05421578_106268 [Paenibacillus macquariensis]
MISKNKDGVPVLFVRFLYNGDDWVFINKYIIKADDSTFEVTPSYGEITKDNDYGEVWEYYSAVVDKNIHEIIQAVISSKKTIIRSQGDDKRNDRTVTTAEKKALQTMLDAFKAMGGSDVQFTL